MPSDADSPSGIKATATRGRMCGREATRQTGAGACRRSSKRAMHRSQARLTSRSLPTAMRSWPGCSWRTVFTASGRTGFGASSGWSGAALLETDDGQANAVQVALSATGDAIVIWRHDSISGDSIRANQYVVGRGWGDHFSIGPTSSFASGARVAFDADGDAIVVWSQQEDPRYDVWARRYVAGTGWGEAELLNTGDDGNALNPQIA